MVLIDVIVLKIRDGQAANRPVYVAMGIPLDGERDVLGMWVGPSGGAGAKQEMDMLTELRNRGIVDVCIVCCDGPKGLPDAITTIWPQAAVQTCVVHLVRNSLRYASKAHWQKITGELKTIYTAKTIEAAEERSVEFAATWRDRYPAMIGMWERSWTEFVPFLNFPVEIRKLIYTTNGIESLNARFRQSTRRRGHFPNEQAAVKSCISSSGNDGRTGQRRPAARAGSASGMSPSPSSNPHPDAVGSSRRSLRTGRVGSARSRSRSRSRSRTR